MSRRELDRLRRDLRTVCLGECRLATVVEKGGLGPVLGCLVDSTHGSGPQVATLATGYRQRGRDGLNAAILLNELAHLLLEAFFADRPPDCGRKYINKASPPN